MELPFPSMELGSSVDGTGFSVDGTGLSIDRTGYFVDRKMGLPVVYALKLDPQPQELVALGFLKTNPRPITSSRKSISVPSR